MVACMGCLQICNRSAHSCRDHPECLDEVLSYFVLFPLHDKEIDESKSAGLSEKLKENHSFRQGMDNFGHIWTIEASSLTWNSSIYQRPWTGHNTRFGGPYQPWPRTSTWLTSGQGRDLLHQGMDQLSHSSMESLAMHVSYIYILYLLYIYVYIYIYWY